MGPCKELTTIRYTGVMVPESLSVGGVLAWISGGATAETTWVLSRWIFLRALGVIYLIAFISLWVQVKGLIGSNGISPMADFLASVKTHYGAERFLVTPTVFWLNASDVALHIVCALGVLSSLLLIFGFAQTPALVLLWILYLSLTIVGQTFLSFQWDILLIEVGFFAIFLAPMNIFPGVARETAVSPLALLLLWFVLFRIMFESGVVKLVTGDPAWWNFTALDYHYFTQPLPHMVSWYVHNLPHAFHIASMVIMYAAELLFPFFIFLARPFRMVGGAGMLFLLAAIMATGNYNFFILLTGALCLLLFDDRFYQAVLPDGVLMWLGESTTHGTLPQALSMIVAIVAIVTFVVGGLQILGTFGVHPRLPYPVARAIDTFDHFRSINSYGLFRVMTRERPEIIVEGSDDGKTWKAYTFKYKPNDDLRERPRFIQPHQPRLDWQMWFAALSSFERTPWFHQFLARLLQGSPDVLSLLGHNPFSEKPPTYVRALLYAYKFTTPEERRESGNYWKRTLRGLYAPVLLLR